MAVDDESSPRPTSRLQPSSTSARLLRAFMTQPSYFHSPTPWSPEQRRLSAKVSELLDSFLPGSYSYRPFKKSHIDSASIQDLSIEPPVATYVASANSNQLTAAPTLASQETLPVAVPPLSRTSSVASASVPTSTSPSSEARRTIYVDTTRPRPFYARSGASGLGQAQEENCRRRITREPRSLQDLSKLSLVSHLGLDGLRRVIRSQDITRMMPIVVQDQVLTFPCEDFIEEECNQGLSPSSSPTSTSLASSSLCLQCASYRVRCLRDGHSYVAIFAVSEADRAVSNLWDEYRFWLSLDSSAVRPVLALVADVHTQNVFFVVKEDNDDDEGKEEKKEAKEKKEDISGERVDIEKRRERIAAMLSTYHVPAEAIAGSKKFRGFHNPILFSKFRSTLKGKRAFSDDDVRKMLEKLSSEMTHSEQKSEKEAD